MKFEVYQINLTDAQRDEVNSAQRGSYPEFFRLYMDLQMKASAEGVLAARHMYEKVAVIEANDMEGVFHIGNMGPEEKIERLRPMHSLSVGDVVVDEAGVASVVASFGFEVVEGF